MQETDRSIEARPVGPAPLDVFRRPLGNLRVSVTDRCNLRCTYCMPEDEYSWLPKRHLLTFEEIAQLAAIFTGLGIRKVRLTGGEPLLRRDLDQLVAQLAANPLIEDLALTTNGVLLDWWAERLRDAGLSRLTISLDTLDPVRFQGLTKRDNHSRVLAGIDAAGKAGFRGTKLNVVVMRGVNDDEIAEHVRFARERDVEVRFIEYMDVGGATQWNRARVVTRSEILRSLEEAFGEIMPLTRDTQDEREFRAPAERFLLGDGTVVGVIASTSAPFCGTCDRSRLTADGRWFRCLYAREGTDLRGALRRGASPEHLARLIGGIWRERNDQGARDRLREHDRSPFASAPELRGNPHLEMHTRGG